MEGTRDEGRKGMKSEYSTLWLPGGARTFLQTEAHSKISNSFYFKPLGRSAGNESEREREKFYSGEGRFPGPGILLTPQ